MDTKFWGPSGWKLLHSITEYYPKKPTLQQKADIQSFFNVIGEVLPCKYCRESFKEYIDKKPIEDHSGNRETLCRWMFDIHNMVNNKLRLQGLVNEKNPGYKLVRKRYQDYKKDPGFRVGNEGMNFISSIAFNYPMKHKCERCKKLFYELFFIKLVKVIPDKKFIKTMNLKMKKKPIQNILQCRKVLKKWMHDFICKYNTKNVKSYNSYCKKIEHYRANGCDKKNHKGNTCRKKTKKTKKKKR